MYPSSNNNGCKSPWTSFSGNYYNDTNYSRTPLEHYYAPSSSSFLLPFPNYVPLEEEPVFGEFFEQRYFSNDHNYHNTIIPVHEMITNVDSTMGESSNNGLVATNDADDEPYDFSTRIEPENSSPRKRPNSKGDRHSKINTARGPRDRRMRLSLDVAKKLFGLQDLLGFDKASKVVDWLFKKSKTAILELLPDHSCSFMGASNSASSTSECEVLSGTGDQSMVKTGEDQATTKNMATSARSSKKRKEKNIRVRRSADPHHPLAKATRERARARARERTTEKRNNIKLGADQVSKFRPCLDQAMDRNVSQLGSWCPFAESQRQNIDQPDHINSHFQFKYGFADDNSSLMKTGNWSPSYFFNSQHIQGLTHEQLFNDFQINGKAWESNTN